MKTYIHTSAILVSLVVAQTTSGQGYTQKGAVLGGLTGAGVGAAIGDHNDEAGAGAVIGGAVGLLAGSLLGNAKDQHYQYQSQYRTQLYQQQRAYQLSRAVSVSDVVALTHNRLSEAVIINLIQNNGLQQPLQVSDIVYLNQQGVSDNVIRVMQDASSGRMAPPVVYDSASPVVVSRLHVVPAPPPVYVPGPRVYYNYSSCGGRHPYHRHCH